MLLSCSAPLLRTVDSPIGFHSSTRRPPAVDLKIAANSGGRPLSYEARTRVRDRFVSVFFLLDYGTAQGCLTPLVPLWSRLGDKPLKLQLVCPQNGTAVLKGLKSNALSFGRLSLSLSRPDFSENASSSLLFGVGNLPVLEKAEPKKRSRPSPPCPNFLQPQSRFGNKPLKFQVGCPENGTAVLKGLRQFRRTWYDIYFFPSRVEHAAGTS